MQKCDKCGERNCVTISSLGKDGCVWSYNGKDFEGYLPTLSSICYDDGCDFTVCVECGWIFGLDLKELKKNVKKGFEEALIEEEDGEDEDAELEEDEEDEDDEDDD